MGKKFMVILCGSDDGIKLKKFIIKYNILWVLGLVIGGGGEHF